MPQQVLGNQVLQDTFEKLGDQAQDTVQGLKDLVTGGNDKADGDNGIEQLIGRQDPKSGGAGSSSAGQAADPQRLAQRQAEEQNQLGFIGSKFKWDEDYKKMQQDDDAEIKKTEEEKRKEEQEFSIAGASQDSNIKSG